MTQPLTPEHLQLLSDRRLDEVARSDDGGKNADRGALARAARYEAARRRCEVPVADRYGTDKG